MVIAHPNSFRMVLEAHTLEAGLRTKSCPTPPGFAGAGPATSRFSRLEPEREKGGQSGSVNAPLVSKWVAIDKASNQKASKTLINLSIPHLPPPHPSPTINGATEPSIEAAN